MLVHHDCIDVVGVVECLDCHVVADDTEMGFEYSDLALILEAGSHVIDEDTCYCHLPYPVF